MRIGMPFITSVVIMTTTHAACSQIINQDYKLDHQIHNGWAVSLGRDVCADGDLLAVSADYDSRIPIEGGGVVYVYDADTGLRLYRLVQDDTEEHDVFGTSLDIADGFLAVGAPGTSEGGSVYYYHALSGAFLRKFVAHDATPSDRFGNAVSMDDGILAVGAYAYSVSGMGRVGQVYLYEAASGMLIDQLLPEEVSAGANYGASLDLHENLLVVGAANDVNDDLVECGAIYIHDLDTNEQAVKICPHDGVELDRFGASVATDGEVILVGSPRDDTPGLNTGSVYVYEAETGEFITKIKSTIINTDGWFGTDVAVEGNIAIVGSYANNSVGLGSGAAYMFDMRTWEQVAQLQPAPTVNNVYEFGSSVALANGKALVGAPREFTINKQFGAAYVFTLPDLECIADVNGDGLLTPTDFTAWVSAFNAGADACDQNADGTCSPTDFTSWITNYNIGC